MADTRSPSSGESSHLRPYPEYKDSGVERLGEIPLHWDTRRLKNWVEINAHVLPETTDPEYEFDYVDIGSVGTGRLLSEPKRIAFASAPSRARRVVRSGDTIVSTVRTYLKAVWHADGPLPSLVASTGFAVLTPRSPTSRRFVGYVCRSGSFTERITSESSGVSYPAIAETKFGLLEIPVPPPSEQKAIANFLDCEIATIDGLVARQEQLIELLREKRTALITRAVTRGLDPSVPRKDTGADWLGEIPAHWEVRKLKRCAEVTGGMTPSMDVDAYWNGSIPWVTPKDMKAEAISDAGIRVTEAAVQETSIAVVESGAVLMVVRGMILVRAVPVAWTKSRVTINQDMKALRPIPGIHGQFLAQALATRQEALLSLVDVAGHGSRRLPTDRWLALPLAIPPSDEQEVIIGHIQESTAALVAATEKARASIDSLREYRTALISAAVTGSIDVRNPNKRGRRLDVPGSWKQP